MKQKVRDLFGCSISLLLIAFGYTRRIRRKAKKGEFILSIYFHSPEKAFFDFCIRWLKKHHFNFLSQDDILAIKNNHLPFPASGVVITVDDGWQSNDENIASIANQHGIPVTIFVSTDPVKTGNFWFSYSRAADREKMDAPLQRTEVLKKLPDGERLHQVEMLKKYIALPREALTIDQVKRISASDYVTIGSHTMSHPILTNCDDQKSRFELSESKEILEGWTGREIIGFAYPNGDYGSRETGYLRDINYKIGFSIEEEYLTPDRLNRIYELPRFCVHEGVSRAEAICRITGVWHIFLKKFSHIRR